MKDIRKLPPPFDKIKITKAEKTEKVTYIVPQSVKKVKVFYTVPRHVGQTVQVPKGTKVIFY